MIEGLLNCLLTAVLLAAGLSDAKTYTIPDRFPVYILLLGGLKIILMRSLLAEAALGVLAGGLPLIFLYIISKSRAIGGGDVKLMMAAGFYLSGHHALTALLIGCLAAVIIHGLRIKFQHAESKLALGPYLSFGIWIVSVLGKV